MINWIYHCLLLIWRVSIWSALNIGGGVPYLLSMRLSTVLVVRFLIIWLPWWRVIPIVILVVRVRLIWLILILIGSHIYYYNVLWRYSLINHIIIECGAINLIQIIPNKLTNNLKSKSLKSQKSIYLPLSAIFLLLLINHLTNYLLLRLRPHRRGIKRFPLLVFLLLFFLILRFYSLYGITEEVIRLTSPHYGNTTWF